MGAVTPKWLMILAAAFLLGLLTGLWWLPLFAGPIGEIAHLSSSPAYRAQLAEVPGARTAAIWSTVTLSGISFGAFFIAHMIRGLF